MLEPSPEEKATIRLVARVMREEAARLPSDSRVGASLERGAEEALLLLSGGEAEPSETIA